MRESNVLRGRRTLKLGRPLPFAAAVVILAIALGMAPTSLADSASDLSTAEAEESAASSQVATADQTVAQAKKALAPIEAQADSAEKAAKEAFAKAKRMKRELVAERTAAARNIADAEATYENEKSNHSTTTAIGIGLAIASLLLAVAAFVVSKLRKWPLSKRLTQVFGGVLGIVFVGGLALAFVPSEPDAPNFSTEEERLAHYAQGNPARPPTPELVKAVLSVKPLLAKARPLVKERSAAEAKLSAAESTANKAHRELTSAKRHVHTAQTALSREEKVAAEEAAFKEEATTIDYKQLIKNANAYKGEKVVYRGQVFQIQEFAGESIILLSVTDEGYGFWTDNIWVDYAGVIAAAEEDIITVYGKVTGSKEYETQAGGSTYVPRIRAKYIEE